MAKLKKINTKLMFCPTCKGNGYIRIDTPDKKDDIKQCWVCQSQGELEKYVQKDVDSFIYDFYFNRKLQ